MAARGKARPYHHGDLVRALVDEGAKQVARSGHPALSLREVAREVGVTHTAAYHHFATRERLLAAVAARGFEAMTVTLQAAAQGIQGAVDQLAALGATYVRHALEHPAIYRLMFSAETADRDRHPELRGAADRTFGVLVEAVERAQHAGEIRAGLAVDLALNAWSSVHGLASLMLDGQLLSPGLAGRPPEDLIGVVLEGFYRGVQPEPAAVSPPPRRRKRS